RHDRAGNEARHLQKDIGRWDRARQHALRLMVSRMSRLGSGDQDMLLCEEALARTGLRGARMSPPGHTDISVRIKPLEAQMAGGPRKGDKREVRLARFQLQCKVPGVERQSSHLDVRRKV